MHVSEDYSPQCYNNNAIIFIDENMEMDFPNYGRPLYLEGRINDIFIRQALVDIGSFINIMPLAILIAARVPTTKVVRSQISINGFGNNSEKTMGYIKIDLKIGPISPEYGGTTRQANKVPKEAEDMHAPIVEDESLQKIMLTPKSLHQCRSRQSAHYRRLHAPDKCKGDEKINRELFYIRCLIPKLTAVIRAFAPLLRKGKEFHIPCTTNKYTNALATLGSKLTFVEEQPNIVVLRKEALTINWRETVRREFFRPSGKLSIKCLKEL
ncbi:hypothetical protein D8674_004716 [Pyrus ussuriensis x Pyrus communis]|uniref:Uncharacterized protein n=1 Tax=Pyrus ussuriensis x Pyrus communis TaxID=2448454 RepID=A0A5N5FPY2_9ROSA|nr:hypothetical protein D8674_004716 [Pyrus ussuriensis x Pyrus communis]